MSPLKSLSVAIALVLGSSLALAAGPISFSAPSGKKEAVSPVDMSKTTERGWFYFDDPKPKEDEPEEPAPKPPAPKPQTPPPKEEKRKDPCLEKSTWNAKCGFVHPGTDFEFQEKQRDALMQAMVMSDNDPKQVEAFQYYMRWVIERTSEVANIWRYNMVQNPELDPQVTQPISSFGLRLMTDIKKGYDKEIFDLMKDEEGMIVVFTRSDCIYCHQMAGTWNDLSRRTGLPLSSASLDDKCIEGMNVVECMTAPATIDPAKALQVTVVPATFLFVKPNTWLRIGTGVVDTNSLATRATQFFSAYRSALLKGIDNGENGRASVDFKSLDPSGLGRGAPMPSEKDMGQMVRTAP